jgi:hypothetical protein
MSTVSSTTFGCAQFLAGDASNSFAGLVIGSDANVDAAG